MINLAVKEISHSWVRYVLTAVGLGLLIGVTVTMTGLVRGMLDDAIALIRGTHADLWVVQEGTMGPYAESSTLYDDVYRNIAGLPGDEADQQCRLSDGSGATCEQGCARPGRGLWAYDPAGNRYLIAGRPVAKSRYRAIADIKTGFRLGDQIIRRTELTVVGLTKGMGVIRRRSGRLRHHAGYAGHPVSEGQYHHLQRAQPVKRQSQTEPSRFARLLQAVTESQQSNQGQHAVLVRVTPGYDPACVAETIKRWKHFEVYSYEQMRQILQVRVIANALRQLGMFMVILAIVSTAIIALIIYNMTMGKIREIAVLKLIGANKFPPSWP